MRLSWWYLASSLLLSSSARLWAIFFPVVRMAANEVGVKGEVEKDASLRTKSWNRNDNKTSVSTLRMPVGTREAKNGPEF